MKRRISTSLFTSVLLLTCLGIFGLGQVANDSKQDVDAYKRRVAQAESRIAEAQFRERLAREEARESMNTLAEYLPASVKGKAKDATTYQLRALASVANLSEKDLGIERASSLLERAKSDFRKRSYEESNTKLQRLLVLYPDTQHGPEARFLLAEGHYQARDYEACIEVVEEMIRLYPESELTGFSLLRLAKIYETRDRIEDAADVYRSVLSHFSQPELRKQAAASLRSVDL